MSAITPNPEQFQALLQSADEGTVVMINMLKFKERADGEPGTGAEAYGRYAAAVATMLEARNARIIWAGRPQQVLVGSEADKWDAVALVEYPSRKAFIDMATSADYQKIHQHREHGLERTVLIACAPGIPALE